MAQRQSPRPVQHRTRAAIVFVPQAIVPSSGRATSPLTIFG